MDSFKGAISSKTAGEAVRRGILKRNPNADVTVFSVGDGGEGTADALIHCCPSKTFTEVVEDTHGDPVCAVYGEISLGGETLAVFDMASAAGIGFAAKHGYDIMHSSTFGVGQLLDRLIQKGYRHILVGLGGSGTNDGGIGALSAMGAVFRDKNGDVLHHPTTSSLSNVVSCDLFPALARMKNVHLSLLYDAAVALTGENGASMMFSKQKGADDHTRLLLEDAMIHFAAVCNTAVRREISTLSGAGAAGGLGYGLSLIGGELTHGAEKVLSLIGFDSAARTADCIITGEGKTDAQTATGKLAATVAKHAMEKTVICLCGTSEPTDALYEGGMSAILSIADRPMTLSESIARTEELLEKTAYDLAGIL